jgi:hypothetical protein
MAVHIITDSASDIKHVLPAELRTEDLLTVVPYPYK